MDADSLQSCAGIPTRTKKLDAQTELYSYENKYEETGGVQITLPIVGGGFKAGGSGSYCHAIARVVRGKVVDVVYTGDNDETLGREGVCAPIVRGCLRAYEKEVEARNAARGATNYSTNYSRGQQAAANFDASRYRSKTDCLNAAQAAGASIELCR